MDAQAFLVRAGALLIALGVAACNTSVGGEGPTQANPLDSNENALVYQLNQVREMAGISTPVILCKSLNVSAAAHSDDMRDQTYLNDMAPDGSTVRTRACSAGYQPGCVATEAMAELVASGIDAGKDVVTQWTMKSNAVLVGPTLVVAGVGESLAMDGTTYWTLDLGDKDDPSCH